MTTLRNALPLLLALAIVASGAVGCKGKKEQPVTTTFPTQQTNTDNSMDSTGGYEQNPDLTNLPWANEPALRTIYFDYDSDVLRPDAVSTLNGNLQFIKSHPDTAILIEGHCDERGTQEYNLALGERRALAVREYLIRLGAPARNIATLSFGEERPAVMGSGESAWSQNRRGEFKAAPMPTR